MSRTYLQKKKNERSKPFMNFVIFDECVIKRNNSANLSMMLVCIVCRKGHCVFGREKIKTDNFVKQI
jgi:hypothetical protein